jgi:hypothetical protein
MQLKIQDFLKASGQSKSLIKLLKQRIIGLLLVTPIKENGLNSGSMENLNGPLKYGLRAVEH